MMFDTSDCRKMTKMFGEVRVRVWIWVRYNMYILSSHVFKVFSFLTEKFRGIE